MNTQLPNSKKAESKKAESENGCLAPLLYWGALFAVFGISKVIAEVDTNLAKWILGIGIVTWFLWPILTSLIGKNLKETKDNVIGFAYLIGLAIAGMFVLGLILLILPSSCTSNSNQAPADIYHRR